MRIQSAIQLCLATLVALATSSIAAAEVTLQPVVEIEEDVYTYEPADNGSGPMWCGGSTCLVRIKDDVFASGIETLSQHQPLNNCRWTLLKRMADGWKLQQADEKGRTREPCPLVGFPDGRLLLSANPTLTGPNARNGPARPEILQFDPANPIEPFETILPKWDGSPPFSEHSYRSFSGDGPKGELILFQNIGYTHAEWAFRGAGGEWTAGRLPWPWGAEYDKPQPIRVCYPNVMLKDRAVHFCGVSDIMEPYKEWREYKKEITGRGWDYDFRRLFYAWSDDITTGEFHDWIEIASRDKTCGWISPCDLWVAPDGAVHILWNERALDTRLRGKYFPDAKQSHALNYAIVRDGKVIERRTLVLAEEGGANETASAGRFQVACDNRLFVFYYVSGTNPQGKQVSENRLQELHADGTVSEPVKVPMEHPMSAYFTATVRGGSPPSTTLDLLGVRVGSSNTISYARIRLWK
ncbi:MAG: hypothetical protein H8E44_21375 [Planctomycetes bacterium]|nr:hypothetical protein [Planctomycetota bacterium]MBL7042644.1 hypothetical protein [Pirellulaceae bacterium]